MAYRIVFFGGRDAGVVTATSNVAETTDDYHDDRHYADDCRQQVNYGVNDIINPGVSVAAGSAALAGAGCKLQIRTGA